MSDEPKKPYDPITVHIGDMGIFQIWYFILISSCKFISGMVVLSHIFMVGGMKYECVEPEGADPCSSNCSKAEYNRSVFKETIISEFGLVCNKAFLASLSQTFVMLGIMLGSVCFGIWADKQGRRIAYLAALLLSILFSFLTSIVGSYWLYALVRFVCAFATGGHMTVSFIIIAEIVGGSKRQIFSIIYQIPFTVGFATLPAFSYFFRDWRKYNLAYSSVVCVLVISICLVIESPRWLFSTGRLDEAIALLERIARIQGKPTENIRSQVEADYRQKIAKSEGHKGKMSELFKTPNLRKNTLVMIYLWMTSCVTFYGVNQYVGTMAGNIFLNVLATAGLSVLGPIVSCVAIQFVGRRTLLIIAYILSGIGLVVIAVSPKQYPIVAVVLGAIGSFGASFIFCVIYLHTSELFPTVVRNSAVGLCSMMGRIGSMIAPQISDLRKVSTTLPPIIFGTMSVIGGLLAFLLPETKGLPLPETIEDGENVGKKPEMDK